MLNVSLFSDWMEDFCQAHGRTIGDRLEEKYYKALKAFSDEEFETLSQKILESHPFFPTPATWLEFKQRELEQELAQWWPAIVRIAEGSNTAMYDYNFANQSNPAFRTDHLPSPIKFALNALPQWREIKTLDERATTALKGKIIELMAEYGKGDRSLPDTSPPEIPFPKGAKCWFKGDIEVRILEVQPYNRRKVRFLENNFDAIAMIQDLAYERVIIPAKVEFGEVVCKPQVDENLVEEKKREEKVNSSSVNNIKSVINQFIDEKVGF